MGQVKGFNDIIADYLKQRAEEDTLFAPKFANPNKSIDECCRYILGEARKRGTAVAMRDSEVFWLAVHYYDEKDIKIEKVSAGCSVSSSQKVKLTEEEKKIAREVAIKRLAEEQYQLLKKKPAKKKADTNVQQMSLFWYEAENEIGKVGGGIERKASRHHKGAGGMGQGTRVRPCSL